MRSQMTVTDNMNIGELAKASGISAKLIRYYESIGLIPPAARAETGYRIYTGEDVHTLRFIKRSRNLGFSIPEIQLLLGLWRNKSRSSSEVKQLALRHVSELEARMAEIQEMVNTLKNLASHCHGDQRPDCPILDDLAGGPVTDQPT